MCMPVLYSTVCASSCPPPAREGHVQLVLRRRVAGAGGAGERRYGHVAVARQAQQRVPIGSDVQDHHGVAVAVLALVVTARMQLLLLLRCEVAAVVRTGDQVVGAFAEGGTVRQRAQVDGASQFGVGPEIRGDGGHRKRDHQRQCRPPDTTAPAPRGADPALPSSRAARPAGTVSRPVRRTRAVRHALAGRAAARRRGPARRQLGRQGRLTRPLHSCPHAAGRAASRVHRYPACCRRSTLRTNRSCLGSVPV